jgi:RNA polymerase sigma-70 factor (ECF subfamily)
MLEILKPDQRACIVLRNIEGLSYKEIAESLEININTVRSRLKRAREILLAHSKQRGVENEM